MNYLSIDVGTTCCKCQLFSDGGEIFEYLSSEYAFRSEGNEIYVDTDAVWARLTDMIRTVASRHEISSMCVSSLGESFVLLDGDDNILFYPMLYTDPRGEREAELISERVGADEAFKISGVMPHSMYSLSKLLWIKNERPELFSKADKLLLVGEYIGYLLTGERVIDRGLAARTGALDIEAFDFSSTILDAVGVQRELFSRVESAGYTVGRIKPEICASLGIKGDPVLVLGSHDQICASLGAGALSAGDAVDGMGTVECITALFSEKPNNGKMGREGYPCVPYAVDGLYCTYMLNYSCCSTVNWFRKKIMHEYKGNAEGFFEYIEKDMQSEPSGLLVLPYFGGASTPYQDLSAKGAVIGLTTETTDRELFRALLEGIAMEMRFNAEVASEYGIKIKNLVATGGGANSDGWLAIKADIQGVPIKTLRSSEGGLCGCAMLQAVALGSAKDLFFAREVFVRYKKEFAPSGKGAAYDGYYEKYKKLYNTVKELY